MNNDQNQPPSLNGSVYPHIGRTRMLAQGSSPNDDHFRDDNYNDDSGNDHLKMVATVRVITTMKTSRKLGDTVPSWLELFLELVLIPEVIGDFRIKM